MREIEVRNAKVREGQEHDAGRFTALIAIGLERWLSQRELKPGVDFLPDVSVTTDCRRTDGPGEANT